MRIALLVGAKQESSLRLTESFCDLPDARFGDLLEGDLFCREAIFFGTKPIDTRLK
jgi:hypothetical protein